MRRPIPKSSSARPARMIRRGSLPVLGNWPVAAGAVVVVPDGLVVPDGGLVAFRPDDCDSPFDEPVVVDDEEWWVTLCEEPPLWPPAKGSWSGLPPAPPLCAGAAAGAASTAAVSTIATRRARGIAGKRSPYPGRDRRWPRRYLHPAYARVD